MAHQDQWSNPNSNRLTVEEINKILEQHDGFIRRLAQRNIPRSTIVADTNMEVDDLAQNIRFKLWQALQKREINNMKGYIRVIVRNEVVNMLRRHDPTMRLLTNDEGELAQSGTVVAVGQEACDPTEHVEVEEMLESYSSNLPKHVVTLPPLQQRAMLCELKDHIADLLPLVDMFLRHGIDIKEVDWPKAENELRSSRVSLSIARKKLRSSMKE